MGRLHNRTLLVHGSVMNKGGGINRFFSNLESRWSLWQLLTGAGMVGSFALPAWGTWAADAFSQYAPLSWVVAGFAGVFLAVSFYSIWAWVRGRIDQSDYNRLLLEQSGSVDPFEKTFEKKRIFLNSFCLPTHPLVVDKTFIDCEIVGPAELHMDYGNSITEYTLPIVDCIAIRDNIWPVNAYIFRNCVFRGCKFIRTTFLVSEAEARSIVVAGRGATGSYFRWIGIDPTPQIQINPDVETALQSLEDTEAETPRKNPRD